MIFKICGLKEKDSIICCEANNAHFYGLIFYENSPRNINYKDAKELINLIKPFRAKVNLIPFNPWPGANYKASPLNKIKDFKKFILEHGQLVATVRMPRGDDVLAACGQLKSMQ